MTDVEPGVAESFERLFPVPLVAADWDDVLDRAGAAKRGRTKLFTQRRALAIAAVLLVGGLLVAPAFGLGGRLLDLVRRAPPSGEGLHDVRDPVWSPDGQRIVFKQLVVGNTDDVYVMNADGSGLRILMHRASDVPLVWSPDGRRIALTAFPRGVTPPRQEEQDLYVVEVDGSVKRLLTRNVSESSLAWSPDGRKIAFVRMRAGVHDVYVTHADGSGTRRIARGVRESGDTYLGPGPSPAWSPDGRKIAFISNRTGTSEIYVMNADGSGQRRLTRNTASEFAPVWSPDGTKIAFERRRGDHWAYNDDIYVMNADGSGLRKLTHSPADDFGAVWSPDGRKIFFVSQRDGEDEIYVMNADGSGQRNLTRNRANDSAPTVSPDGRTIAFVSTRDGRQEVFVMNADGSGVRRLTQRGP
jgi:Tol biopolymer transport system component